MIIICDNVDVVAHDTRRQRIFGCALRHTCCSKNMGGLMLSKISLLLCNSVNVTGHIILTWISQVFLNSQNSGWLALPP